MVRKRGCWRVLENKLQMIPEQPGVYQMLDESNEIIYIGKARNLRNRLRQYFHSDKSQAPKVRAMMKRVRDIHTIVTDTEVEALILEANLIKENRPRYNILMRDDKSYPYIKITYQDDFPRVMKTRNFIKDGSRYFGPYTDAGAVNDTLNLIRRMYPIRKCSRKINKETGRIDRPCLNYHLHHCLGPCQGTIYQTEYRDLIRQVEMLLSGKTTELRRQIEKKMAAASKEMNYEEAARHRDQLQALDKVTQEQKMDSGVGHNQDIIATANNDGETSVQLFTLREGRMIRQNHFMLQTKGEKDKGKILSSFIKQYYSNAPIIPDEILVETIVEDDQVIENWLTGIKGRKVLIRRPQRGTKKKLVDLAVKNASMHLQQLHKQQMKKDSAIKQALFELHQIIRSEQPPIRIEAVDISHTAGSESVGALVVFEHGLPAKNYYRKYRMRHAMGADDTGNMRELLGRRFRSTYEAAADIAAGRQSFDETKYSLMPDLLLVDGGTGQISAAEQTLTQMKLDIPVMGMVKDDRHRTRWLLYRGERFDLQAMPQLWRLITAIQDEAHRFALAYHQQRRSRQLVHSSLTMIPGVGEKRRKQLMDHFKNINRIQKSSLEELKNVPGIPDKVAESIYHHYRNQRNQEEREDKKI